MKKIKRLLLLCSVLVSICIASNVSATTTRLVPLKKNKTVTVYAKKSEVVRLKALSLATWTTSKKTVATVRRSGAVGIVTSKTVGTTVIKAVKGKTKWTCKFIVENPKLNKTNVNILKGKKTTLKVNGTKQTVKWTSSNKNICTISSKGVITAKNAGTATITAVVGGRYQYSCFVTVTTPPIVLTDNWTVKNVYFDYYQNKYDGSIEYDAVVTIHNSGNTNLYLKSCGFDIYNTAGQLLHTETHVSTCRQVIYPGEDGYFYSSSETIKNANSSTRLVLKYNPTIKRATGAPNRFSKSDVTRINDDIFDTDSIIGHVHNYTEKNLSYLYVHCVFFDAYGKAIGVSGSSATDIAPNGYGSFKISTYFSSKAVAEKKYSRYEVVAEDSYYQFDW